MAEKTQASMVCVPCKRRKKGCDKKLPTCSRCERLNANCCYPKEVTDSENGQEVPLAASITNPSLSRSSPAVLCYPSPDFDEIAVNTLHSLSEHVNTAQAEQDFTHYFSIYHINLPIVNKDDFLRKLQRNSLEPHFILLKLTISIVAQLTSERPGAFHRGRDLYSPLKAIHSQYQNSSTCSVDLLLAGLLIATYEYSQDLLQQSWFTIGACLRMGQILRLDRQGHDIAQSTPVWWWGIVIIERLIAADYMMNSLPIGSEPPRLHDVLPVMDLMDDPGQLLSHDLFLAEHYNEHDGFVRPPVTFTSLTPFSTTLQATYLNHLVTEHILNGSEDFTTRRLHTLRLTVILQHYEDVLVPPPGEAVGHYCGAYGLQTCALFRLHEGELLHAEKVNDTVQVASSKHFLQALTHKTVVSLRVLGNGVPPDIATLALWSHKIIYHTAKCHVRYGVRDKDWASDLERCKNYMRYLSERMKLHEQYLREVEEEELIVDPNEVKAVFVCPGMQNYTPPDSVMSCHSMR